MADAPTEDIEVGDGDEVSTTESHYRFGVGVTLAALAVLGAWIAVMGTNAGTNESRTARDATRLAAEAQTADVVDKGVQAGLDQIAAEVETFGSRPAFYLAAQGVAQGLVTLDPTEEQRRLDEATQALDGAIVSDAARRTEISEEAARLSLEQRQVVAERITWNARASQYETVLTVLAVAIFLVGFTMVVSRGLRPPFVVPGVILAVFCFGWAIQIYTKPIPSVAPAAIESSAQGQVALEGGRAADAIADFTDAVEADGGYQIAHRGLGSAILVDANPDLLNTFAITDTSPEVVGPAQRQLEIALDEGGSDDPRTVTNAAVAALVAGDWERTGELLDDAIERNPQTPGLSLNRSAVALAEGDSATADEELERALELLRPLAGGDTVRELAAQYLTVLEWVEAQVPERAEDVDEYRRRLMRFIAEVRADQTPGVDLTDTPGDVELSITELAFADDRTTVDLDAEGLAPNDQVLVAVYERPAPGASWIQAPELFYVGVPTSGQGITLPTPRACVPVEYRVDLYVSGIFADTAFAPGGAPTC